MPDLRDYLRRAQQLGLEPVEPRPAPMPSEPMIISDVGAFRPMGSGGPPSVVPTPGGYDPFDETVPGLVLPEGVTADVTPSSPSQYVAVEGDGAPAYAAFGGSYAPSPSITQAETSPSGGAFVVTQQQAPIASPQISADGGAFRPTARYTGR